ncbi:APC family permease [Sporosarcina sp. ZBG7A]|uniref:APC family permease n=1 Tax=Sporosarcina sp. ZBG7A TaxID=1582223 RepID=UPI00057A9C30|nr:APC family permease [Sporosarcina sp. ZBG7A]
MANVKDAGHVVLSTTSSHLNKSLSKWDLLSIGIGAVIGWSWVIYGGIWTTLPGSIGGVMAFLIGGLLCTFVGLTYAELSSALPYAGGDIVYTFEGLGARWAYFSGAFLTIIFIGLIIIETIMFPMMLEALGFPVVEWLPLYNLGGETVYLSYILLSMVVNLFFAVLNYRGIEFSKVFQTITVGVLLFASVFYVFSGVTLGSIDNAKPFFTGFSGLSLALLMVPGFMLGFNAVAQAAEETTIKPSMIGKVVIATVWASVAFYVLIIIGTALSADAELRASGGIVVLNSLQNLYTSSSLPMYFVAIASLIGLLTSWNASYIAASRILLSLGRGKYVAPAFSKVHPQFKTPGNATIFLFIVSSFGAFLGTSQLIFGSLVDVVGVITVSSWLLVAISFVRLRQLRPDLERPYRVKRPKLLGFLSIGSLVFFLLLYTPLNPIGGLSPAETIVTIILLVVVVVYYFKNVHSVKIDEKNRREMLFGKEE